MINEDRNPEGGAYSFAMAENGDSAFPTRQGIEEDTAAQKEQNDIHEHADPSKGGKEAEGGNRIKSGDVSPGAADEQATRADRSI